MKHFIAFVLTVIFLVVGAYYSAPSPKNEVEVEKNFDESLLEENEETYYVDETLEHLDMEVPNHSFIERVTERDSNQSEEDTYEIEDPSFDPSTNRALTGRDLAYVEFELEGDALQKALNEKEEVDVDPRDVVEDMYYADLKEAEDYNYELNDGTHVEWSHEELEMLGMESSSR